MRFYKKRYFRCREHQLGVVERERWHIDEDVLHFIWKRGLWDVRDACTTEGVSLELIDVGRHNEHAGPDFFNAKLRVGEQVWAGTVEMHLRSSDWLRHGHSADPLYDSVILHVVWEEDVPIYRRGGERIPCLELKGRVDERMLERYARLMRSTAWVPCAGLVGQVPSIHLRAWTDRMVVERLEAKALHFQEVWERLEKDLEQTLYVMLMRNFGFGVNNDAFEELAMRLPYRIVQRHRTDRMDVEAMYYGVAGFLGQIDEQDGYVRELQLRFAHWRKKYALVPLSRQRWRFFRLRPYNFPTIRIAQFVDFITRHDHLVASVVEAGDYQSYAKLFDLRVSPYWRVHYRFGTASKRSHTGRLSPHSLHLLLINTVVPFLFFYADSHARDDLRDRAMEILEALPPEDNAIIRGWRRCGLEPGSALDTQAWLHLRRAYCEAHRCVHCRIGQYLIAGNDFSKSDENA